MKPDENDGEQRAIRELWFTVDPTYDLRAILDGAKPGRVDARRYQRLQDFQQAFATRLLRPLFDDAQLRPLEKVALDIDTSLDTRVDIARALERKNPRLRLTEASPRVVALSDRLRQASRAQAIRLMAPLQPVTASLAPFYRIQVYRPLKRDRENDPLQQLRRLPGVRAAFDAPLLVRDGPPLAPTDPWLDPASPLLVPISSSLGPRMRDQWSVRRIGVPEAWGISTGERVRVGIVDSGVSEHPDLPALAAGSDNRVLEMPGKPGALDPHGTMVAGIISAQPSKEGTVGIAPDAELFSCVYGGTPLAPLSGQFRGEGTPVTPEPADWVAGIVRAVDAGAQVINCSWHLELPCCAGTLAREVVSILREALLVAAQAGVAVVCSMGNRSQYGEDAPYQSYPAAFDGETYKNTRLTVISVGGVLDGPRPAEIVRHFASNFGDRMTLVAPAYEVPTTDLPGKAGRVSRVPTGQPRWFINYSPFGQTSAAAAHVTGVVALMLSINPRLSPHEVQGILSRTAEKVGTLVTNSENRNAEYGFGLVNAAAATAWVAGDLVLKRFLSVMDDIDDDEERLAALLVEGFFVRTERGRALARGLLTHAAEISAILKDNPDTAEDIRELFVSLSPYIRAAAGRAVAGRRLRRQQLLLLLRRILRELRAERPSAALSAAIKAFWAAVTDALDGDEDIGDVLGATRIIRRRRRRII